METNPAVTMETWSSNETVLDALPIPVLAERLIEYKISIYILTYVTVPVAVWGWLGNAISFR